MINNKLSFSKLVLIIVVLLTVVAIAYSFIFKQNPPITVQPTSTPTISPSPIVATSTPTPTPTPVAKNAGWIVYRNDKYGFELEHPKDYKEEVTEDNNGKINVRFSIDTTCGYGCFIMIGLTVSDNKNYDFFSVEDFKEWHAKYMPSNELKDVEKITINQLPAFKTHAMDGINSTGEYVYFHQGELVVILGTDSYKNSSIESTFNQILSTFKFIK